MHILHLITGLGVGGAEIMLYRLLTQLVDRPGRHEVVSLLEGGPLAPKIEALGVPVHSLGMRRVTAGVPALLRLARHLREGSPTVMQSWMYHADLAGALASRAAPGIPLVWGIHHTDLDAARDKRSTRWIARVSARLSHRWPTTIVCCSEASRQVHIELGYDSDKMIVIPNGFDLGTHKPNPNARLTVRAELELPSNALLVGIVGRYHPQKDHLNFVQAVERLAAVGPVGSSDQVPHFVMCGSGVDWDNTELAKWIHNTGLEQRFHLLGQRSDVPRIMAALDLLVSSSSAGEGLPLVIGEAMACGVPCVVTDVGDAARVVGDTGRVVPPREPQALADALWQLLVLRSDRRRRLGGRARERIAERYSLEGTADAYSAVYNRLSEG